jgi:hypothetical protein
MNFSFRRFQVCALLLLATLPLRADVLELVNGDRYQGKIVKMTDTEIEFQSDVQGKINLARDKVAHINFQNTSVATTKPTTNTLRSTNLHAAALTLTNSSSTNLNDAVIQQMKLGGIDPAIITQVQEQVFGGGSPEAGQKFNEMLAGFTSGSLSVQDIRKEAQDSIKQIHELKKELGGDAGDLFDGYVAILEKFVADTAPPPTNAAAAVKSVQTSPVPAAAAPAPKAKQ